MRGAARIGKAFVGGAAASLAVALAAQPMAMPKMTPAARDPATLRGIMLDAHNRARAAAGTPPLVWSDALAADARAWAAELARTSRFQHAPVDADAPQGENLWAGTAGAYGYAEMAAAWVDERRWFVDGPMPDVSTNGRWQDVAHYTQIVWRETREVGCAVASNADVDDLVCRYRPAGNVVGERAVGR